LPGQPELGIGAGSRIEGSIVDKNCRIGTNVVIVNGRQVVDDNSSDQCLIRDGIPVVVKEAVIHDGWRLE
jgi:glucose-1-phosphate adenylyltransferase